MLVLDTNAIIYRLAGEAAVSNLIITKVLEGEELVVPATSVVEFLSFPKISDLEISRFNIFLGQTRVAALDLPLAQMAGRLRKDYRMSLGDSVVAATALSFRATLVTRNVKDFKKVRGLKLLSI